MTLVTLIVLIATTVTVSAQPQRHFGGQYTGLTGIGDPPQEVVRHTPSPSPRSISRSGDDAFRFRTSPSLGGTAFVFDIAPKDEERATGTLRLFYGHPALRWKREGSLIVDVPLEDYRALMSEVDAALERAPPVRQIRLSVPNIDQRREGEEEAEEEEIIVCGDGGGYITERRREGETRWLAGTCGDHPNDDVAIAVKAFLNRYIDEYLRL